MKPADLHLTHSLLSLTVAQTAPWVFVQGFFIAASAIFAVLWAAQIFRRA